MERDAIVVMGWGRGFIVNNEGNRVFFKGLRECEAG